MAFLKRSLFPAVAVVCLACPAVYAEELRPGSRDTSDASSREPAIEHLAEQHLRLARALERAGDAHAALRELRIAYELRDRPARGLLLQARQSIARLRAHLRRASAPKTPAARAQRDTLRRAVSHVERALARCLRTVEPKNDAAGSSDAWGVEIAIDDEVLVPVAWRSDVSPPRLRAAYPGAYRPTAPRSSETSHNRRLSELIVPSDWSSWTSKWPSQPDDMLLVPRGW